jgi:hypothetical protein
MEGSGSTGQSPQWAVVPVEEEEEEVNIFNQSRSSSVLPVLQKVEILQLH